MGYDKSTFRIFSGKRKYFIRASGSIQHPCIDSQPFPLFQYTEILFFILFIFFSGNNQADGPGNIKLLLFSSARIFFAPAVQLL